ncbi:hypothetical protein C8R44DRAFT_890981 [Mycena epipterygia]|nr:hypothetical protein C8R44DRAFT_890981 [Mycena epipterygia]
MAPKNASADEVLKAFIARAPASQYTFDSERDATQSEICRAEAPNLARECIILQMHSKRLFEAMQNLGFFCALPMDPKRTHMECTPIPK